MIEHRDIPYAEVDGHKLFLNIFLPENHQADDSLPLVMYIHGGGWQGGSYESLRMDWLPEHAYAVASVGYHLTDKKLFPQQIYDVKGALRWLKAHACDYGYDVERIAVAGGSAGGQLATLLAVSSHMPELEGDVGGNLEQSNSVKAVVNYFGPVDLMRRHKFDPLHKSRPSFKYLGGKGDGDIDWELCRLATTVEHITADAPPLITIHGEADNLVFIEQAEIITQKYKDLGLHAELYTEPGAGHGDQVLFDPPHRDSVLAFLHKYL